jgi:hypothetical protein
MELTEKGHGQRGGNHIIVTHNTSFQIPISASIASSVHYSLPPYPLSPLYLQRLPNCQPGKKGQKKKKKTKKKEKKSYPLLGSILLN